MSIASLQAQSQLSIRLFGGFSLAKAALPLPRTRTRSGQWLLALLALRPDREVQRAWLAGVLWPDSAESQALYNLRRSLSEVRGVLGKQANCLLSPTPRSLLLDTSHTFVDIVEFDRALERGDPASLQQAVALYGGPLLQGCLEEWALPEQRRYERAYLSALDTLARAATAQHHPVAAMDYHRQALACDPLCEAALQGLMGALAASGDSVGALGVYRQFRLSLHHSLQAEPDAETVAIYDHIRAANGKKRPTVSAAPPFSPHFAEKSVALHAVPHPLTPLIGRAKEITKIVNCLRHARLVTLLGTGGIGKTRLAIAAAHQVAGEFADGIWFLDLASLTDPSHLTHAAATLLGVPGEQENKTQESLTLDALCRFLADKSLLLILDSCEHLIEACAALTETVLGRCPNVRILATSRQAIGIYGEQSWRVPGLSLPEETAAPLSSGMMEETPVFAETLPADLMASFAWSDAVRLFVEGAIAANAAFRLTPDNMRHVIKICRMLDGIPFALELASARVKSLPVAQIAERLDNRFDFLRRGSRTARPQHQTLRATLDWSYHLLSKEEKTLLGRLAVFSGGWTLDAAEAITQTTQREAESRPEKNSAVGIPPLEVLDLLTCLVDKSLVVYDEQSGATRYRLLETTRQYANDQQSATECTEDQRRHADFFLRWARQAQDSIEQVGITPTWQLRIRTEQDNLRTALAWWREEDIGQGARILYLLIQLGLLSYHSQEACQWVARLGEADLSCTPQSAFLYRIAGEWANWLGHMPEALHLWEKSLEAATHCRDKRAMALVLLNIGCNTMDATDYTRAESSLHTCQIYFEEMEDIGHSAEASNRLGILAFYQGDTLRAQQYLEQSLQSGRDQDNPSLIADALDMLGYIASRQQEHGTAKTYFAELVDLLHSSRNRFTANALRHLGATEGALGDFTSAWQHLEAARALNRQVGFLPGEGWDLYAMAEVAWQQGHEEAAWTYLERALHLFDELGETGSRTTCLRRWAQFEARAGQWERAVCLWSHAERLTDCYSWPVPTRYRVEFNAFLASCRTQLTEARFQAVWAQGQKLQREHAVEYALATHTVPVAQR